MKKVYLNTLTPEEVIKRLKNGEVIKYIIDDYEVIYKMIDGVIIRIDKEYTMIGAYILIDENDDIQYFEEEEEPFKITETGIYKTRDGRKAFVYDIDEETDDDYIVFYILEKEGISHSATIHGEHKEESFSRIVGFNISHDSSVTASASQESSLDIVAKWED